MSPAMQAAENYMPLPSSGWRLVTDNVMGGVSSGKLDNAHRLGRDCIALGGNVSTDNNGGFIQMALDLDSSLVDRMKGYDGVRLQVLGNGEPYNIHLRTHDLWFPWQAYRATFKGLPQWQQVDIPFSSFKPYKTSSELDVSRLKRVGIVAIGRDFTADICVAAVGFFRNDG